jgi:sortase A
VTNQPMTAAPARSGAGWIVRTVRAVGWTLILTGVLILLYLVYLLFFTGLQTGAAQGELLNTWELEFGAVEDALPGEPGEDGAPVDPVSPGDAYAALWFERDGERIVHDDALFVIEGTSLEDLKRGPGHYSDSQAPGQEGNFAVAGHRTTYGQPFYNLDQLATGDEVHVVDRDGRKWVYEVREQRIVSPHDVWVVDPDPLGEGGSWLTLTTCHPRWSAAQRLIVFAELSTESP